MVLWETEGDFKARFRQTDPYFEDEPVAELGCSMEQAVGVRVSLYERC